MRREKRFETLECPLRLDELDVPERGVILLEDMGNLVANELYDSEGAGQDAAQAILRGVENLHRQGSHLIVVSNEVFRGGADYAGDTDAYLLALARVNNALAAKAENVCRVVCGIPQFVKGGNGFDRCLKQSAWRLPCFPRCLCRKSSGTKEICAMRWRRSR